MLLLLFVLYSSPFVGTSLKYEILGAALELCHLKSEHFSPGILKFNTKHENNPFTLNCSTVLCTFLFIFHAGSLGLGSKNFWNSSYKATFGPCFQTIFPFLTTMEQETPSRGAFRTQLNVYDGEYSKIVKS